MNITIHATKWEVETMKEDLYSETGQVFETNEQVAAGLSCVINERIELPEHRIKIKVEG